MYALFQKIQITPTGAQQQPYFRWNFVGLDEDATHALDWAADPAGVGEVLSDVAVVVLRKAVDLDA